MHGILDSEILLISTFFKQTNLVICMLFDLLGALLSLLSTYYFIRLDQKAWVFGFFATCINALLYWQKGIYADMLLEVFYCISTCFGWFLWRKSTTQKNSSIIKLSFVQQCIVIVLIISLYFIIVNLLTALTHSDIAELDALTTALSMVAQGLMCFRVISTWGLWFITDAIYAYLYLHKQLPFHSILMLVYTTMAVVGYFSWLKFARRDVIVDQEKKVQVA